MLISQRRLKWSAVILLAICCVVLYRPLRSGLDQFVVHRALHPNLKVGELVIHKEKSIVEARNLKFSGQQGDRRFGLTATRGWFAVDQAPLVDAQIQLPKVILQDARLFLSSSPPTPSREHTGWTRQVANRIAALDWQKIKNSLDSVLASQDLADTWQRRIDRWVQRSNQIVSQATDVQLQAQSLDNPLRYEDVLHGKLAQVEELAKEQQILIEQYDSVKKLLRAECTRLHELQESDLQRIRDVSSGNPKAAPQPEQLELCSDLALELAHSVWERFSGHAEVSDHLARLARASRPEAHNVDVRDASGRRLFDLKELKARGIFEYGSLRTPFEATGKCSLFASADFVRQSQQDWAVAFYQEHEHIAVQVLHDSQLSGDNQLSMAIQPRRIKPSVASPDTDSSPSDRAINIPTAAGVQRGSPCVQCRLSTRADGLDGTMVVQAEALTLVDNPMLERFGEKLESNTSARELEFVVRGSWDSPNFKLCEPAPAWLLAAIEDEIQSELREVRSQAELRLESEFHASQERLQSIIDTVVQRGRQLTQAHQQQLLATEDRLRQQLDEMTGDGDFARRPSSLHR